MTFEHKNQRFSLFLILVSWLTGVYFYANFPDKVPIHWNIANQANGWSGPGMAAFLGPAIIALTYIIFRALPFLDPKKADYQLFKRQYEIIQNSLLAALTLIFLIAGMAGLGYQVAIGSYIIFIIGLLFIIIGSQIGSVKPNWFIGIRTPWTLSDPQIWEKTNRLGGKLLQLAGLFCLVSSLFSGTVKIAIFITAIIIAAFAPIIYSYVLYRSKHKQA